MSKTFAIPDRLTTLGTKTTASGGGMSADGPGNTNTVQGGVTNLFQIQQAFGDINSAAGPSRFPVPQQLPPEPAGFENQAAALRSLTARDGAGPRAELLLGPPGSGKSALALHWANLVADRFPDGRIYLDLRGHDPGTARTAHEALGFLLTSLGTDPATLPADTDHRVALWRTVSFNRRLLIILDNAADAAQVGPLLSTGPATVTVITSRNALSELGFLGGVHATRVDPLTPQHAVALLRHLIEPLRGPVDDQDLSELAELCGHLQLALRVAAQRLAKSPLSTVAELNGELRDRARILDPVRAVFDSSYRNLSPAAARLFRLLGVAPGADLHPGAITALTGADTAEARTQIEELLGGHLLTPGSAGRLVIHDLLQAYAAELAGTPQYRDESDAALNRLGQWYTQAASAAARAIGSEQQPTPATVTRPARFPSGAAAQEWYRHEEPNLSIMVRTLAAHAFAPTALDLCSTVVELYAFNNASAWQPVAATGLHLAQAAGNTHAQAWFLESLGKAHTQTGDLDQALAHHEAALKLRTQDADEPAQARSLNALGLVHNRSGSLDRAAQAFSACLELAGKHHDQSFVTFARMNLGLVTLNQAKAADPADQRPQYEKALALLNTALAGLDPDEQQFYRANALYDRAETLVGLGRLDDAHADALEAAGLARSLANTLVLAPALRVLAQVKAALGDTPGAQADLAEAIDLFRALGDQAGETEARRLLDETG